MGHMSANVVPDPRDRDVRSLLSQLAGWQPAPPPFTPGSHPLWTDEHVSRGMLAAHLDPDRDAASRRPTEIDASCAFIAGHLRPGSRILDLGCGPGLYTARLSAAGFDVTGVDYSARSIEHARAHDPGTRYLPGDYRTVEVDGPFDAVLLIYLDLGTFSPPDTHRILDRVRHWLAPDGVFAFDVATPRLREGSEERRDWGVAADGYWAPEPHAWLSRTLRYDEGPTWLDEYVVVTAAQTRVYRVWERCFTPGTIDTELRSAGLATREVFGDLTGTPYRDTSPTIGVLASRA